MPGSVRMTIRRLKACAAGLLSAEEMEHTAVEATARFFPPEGRKASQSHDDKRKRQLRQYIVEKDAHLMLLNPHRRRPLADWKLARKRHQVSLVQDAEGVHASQVVHLRVAPDTVSFDISRSGDRNAARVRAVTRTLPK